jgi:hypothetical protein
VTDEQTNIPAHDAANMPDENVNQTPENDALPVADDALPFSDMAMDTPPEALAPAATAPPAQAPVSPPPPQALPEDGYDSRLERLGGEPAPAITPEEFARLQRAGQVQIDARGRVRTARRNDSEAGVSLRKRRAWYG